MGVHQGLVLILLLFLALMEALTCEVRTRLSVKLWYADDLVVIAESNGGVEGEDIEME